MARVTMEREISTAVLERTLAEALGPRFSVSARSESEVRVGRRGIPAVPVRVRQRGGVTVLTLGTSGLVVSRLLQMLLVHPSIRRAASSPARPSA